jgi:aromatic ring-opening dioxygenase LigB subunit
MMNFDNMSTTELQAKLNEYKDLFDEVTEERMVILSQRNIHLSSKVVVKYQNELQEIQENSIQLKNSYRIDLKTNRNNQIPGFFSKTRGFTMIEY